MRHEHDCTQPTMLASNVQFFHNLLFDLSKQSQKPSNEL